MRLTAGFAVLFAVGTAPAQEKTEWTKFVSPKGMYEVTFPGKVTEKNIPPAGFGATLNALGGKAAFVTQVNFHTKEVDPGSAEIADTMFKAAHIAVAKSLGNPRILSDTIGTMDKKYPTKDVSFDAPGLGVYRTKWVITAKGFYQIIAAGPKEFVEGKDVKTFMDSFKIDAAD